MTSPTERQIEDLICDYLSYIPNSHYIKNAPSGFFDGKKMVKHRSSHMGVGVSDIFFWHESKFYAFEVKTPVEHKFLIKHYNEIVITQKKFLSKKKQHLKDQINFIKEIKLSGHQAEFVSSIEQVEEILGRAKTYDNETRNMFV